MGGAIFVDGNVEVDRDVSLGDLVMARGRASMVLELTLGTDTWVSWLSPEEQKK